MARPVRFSEVDIEVLRLGRQLEGKLRRVNAGSLEVLIGVLENDGADYTTLSNPGNVISPDQSGEIGDSLLDYLHKHYANHPRIKTQLAVYRAGGRNRRQDADPSPAKADSKDSPLVTALKGAHIPHPERLEKRLVALVDGSLDPWGLLDGIIKAFEPLSNQRNVDDTIAVVFALIAKAYAQDDDQSAFLTTFRSVVDAVLSDKPFIFGDDWDSIIAAAKAEAEKAKKKQK